MKVDELVKTENSPPRRRERGDKSLIIKNSSLRPLRLCGEKRAFTVLSKLKVELRGLLKVKDGSLWVI
jgi:hypothetical protein